MSAARAAQDAKATQDSRRRKRRTGGRHTPEPKNIVSGAGQPLDLSVRREAEERLGYDFGQVRLHTDRDADALTELLGADAVAVGRDIFFRAGAYRPGTTDGRRLLAHELLHTVQDPHGLGALKAGRDQGAVSLPEQPAERTAEDTARTAERPEDVNVEPEAPTPGWMRYATVTADRLRAERLDPATLPDRLATNILRTLRGDPADWSKRTRVQLSRLPEQLVEPVLERLEKRLLSTEYERVLDFLDEVEDGYDVEPGAHEAPVAEPDAAEWLRQQREAASRQAADEREDEQRADPAPGPEKEQYGTPGAVGSTPRNGGVRGDQITPQGATPSPGGGGQRQADSGTPDAPQPAAAAAAAPAQQETSGGPEAGAEQGPKESAEAPAEAAAQQETPAASPEESAARNRPEAAQAVAAAQQVKPEDKRGLDVPTGSPTVAGKDTQLSGAVSTLDPVRNQDTEGLEEEPPAESPPTHQSEVDVGGGQKSAWDITLQPEDFLPAQDPDVSGIPTADQVDAASGATPPMPSFPAPPVTRADQVQAERDAEDAEDEAALAEAEREPVEPERPLEMEAEPGADSPVSLEPEPAVEAPPGPGTTSRSPTSGADPKAGPVAAQTTVQAVAGRSEPGSGETEQAAKEEKGTPAAGDKAPAAPEKAPQQPASGQAAPAPAENSPAPSGSGGTGSETSAPAAPVTEPAPAPATPGAPTEVATAPAPMGEQTTVRETPSPESALTSPGPAAPAPAAPAPARASTPGLTPAPASQGGSPEPSTAPGGRGGGSAAGPPKRAAKESPPAPNLSTVSPEAGLATAGQLKPHRALEAMTSVGSAADRTVGDEHKNLAAAPPSMQRPAGAPQTLSGAPKTDAPVQYSQDPAKRSEAPNQEKAEVTGAKEPEGPIEAEKEEGPSGWDTFKMALGFGLGKLANLVGIDVDATELAAKFAGLPTKDEALKQAMAGNAPGVQASAAAEQTSGEQGTAVDAKGQDTVTAGRDDASRGMGEDQVYPDVPPEQMQADVPARSGGPPVAAGSAPTGVVPAEAASKVAEHDNGPRLQAAFQQGQQGMSQGRQAKDQGFRESQSRHRSKVSTEVTVNTQSQRSERDNAFGDVDAQRAVWRRDQDAELSKLGTKKSDRQVQVRKDVTDREKQADDDVEKEKTGSDKKIQDEAGKAERDANQERDSAVQDSGNWVTKAFDWIKQKVIEIKNAIVRVIRAARDAVVGFIKNFKETVERWINEARTFIVDAIKKLINDLIELAKALVRAIVDLAKKIRNLITDLIQAAIDLVNKLAAQLKQIIKDLLDALGKLLGDLLKILFQALMDVIKATIEAIKQVLAMASQLLGMLGTFLFVAIDFLSDPGGWLSGAKNSAVDGAKNHLFREVKSAVKQWFQSKIEEVLGIGKSVIDTLIKGGFTLEKIVKETWDAIVPMLPVIIGEIVITKVIAKLIPGAGWVMAVIDAIKVAIGALAEILRAMGAVLAWLISVRQGGAGILFAKAVAAGIVALLELAYEALLSGIGKYVAKVGKRLKGVAQRMLKGKKGDAPGQAPRREGEPEADTRRPDGETPQATPRPVGAGTPGTTPRPRPAAGPGSRPAAGPGSRPTVGPRPSGPSNTRPGGGSTVPDRPKSRPDTTPAGGRPDGARPSAPKPTPATAPRKPSPATSKDKDGRPKTAEDERPDTRPTPPVNPKPKAEPPAKPSEPQPTSKDMEPKPKGTDPTKPKGTDPTKPKGEGSAGPKQRKGGDEGPPGRPKERRGPRDRGERERPRADGEQRRDQKDQERDGRKKKEESEESKEARLAWAVARIQPRVEKLLSIGVPRPAVRVLLGGLRLWYRLTGLDLTENGDAFGFLATLNPRRSFGSEYWDQFSRVGNDAIRRFNENAEQTRTFSMEEQNRNAELYGRVELGHHMDELPADERRAVLEYSDFGPIYNNLLRAHEDPHDMLAGLRPGFEWRKVMERIMRRSGPGPHPHFTPADLEDRINDPGLDDFDREILRGVLNVGQPGDTPEQVQSRQRREIARMMRPMPSSRQEQIALSFGEVVGRRPGMMGRIPRFPTPDEVLERSVLIDEATRRNRLTEGIEAHRTVGDINFMGPRPRSLVHPPDLIGTEHREPGFMSTSLGGQSTFARARFQFRVNVPRGQPVLWIGRTSRYPHQRELLLPSNTPYVVRDVEPRVGAGPWVIVIEILPQRVFRGGS